jgi:hypothetical protein
MTYRGRVQGGVVVLDDPAALPEGAEVSVELTQSQKKAATTLGQRLMELSGKAKGLPSDAALNHDHYLYGTPKK